MTESVDAVVIGMGPGGEEVAGSLAEAGLRVVGVERALVGGECPYWGCVPTKMMIRAADLLAEARRIPGVAGSASVAPDWAPVAQRVREQATDDWDDRVAVDRFVGKGGTFVRGEGVISGPGRVTVNGATYSAARAVVVATGTAPSVPPIPGLDSVRYWTNHDAVQVESLPGTLVVLGRRRRWPGAGPGVRPLRGAGHGRRGRGAAAAGRGARGWSDDRRGPRARGYRGPRRRPGG
jgi:pyruvate/2-oxoglutarate dehydrogenase complex dihydrolipoamide dehydrogenase (E3) component